MSQEIKACKRKPCPFPKCKSKESEIVVVPSPEINEVKFWVECKQCFACGPCKESEEEAIKAWNEAKR